MASVHFDGVSKVYGDGAAAVAELQLTIGEGEFMVLVGPSGCGKSTALRMVAGLEEITSGSLRIGDVVVNDLPPGERNIAMVFQNYALYPHLTVRDNMGFALTVAKVPKAEIRRRVDAAADVLGLRDYLDRLPKQLSGGQRQRVAMGRSIVREPAVFLMDEPLSNLDAKLRVQMRSEIIRLQARLATTMLYVTHDQVEAMTMGHRVAVMRKGVLQQVAPPQDLYEQPANLFVASFIGSPAMNLFIAEVERRGTELWLRFAEHELHVPDAALARYPLLDGAVGGRVTVGFRPEHVVMASDLGAPPGQTLDVPVLLAESMGSEVQVHFGMQVETPEIEAAASRDPMADDHLDALPADAGTATFIARVDGMHRVRNGERVQLGVRADRAHFFDVATGAPLRP